MTETPIVGFMFRAWCCLRMHGPLMALVHTAHIIAGKRIPHWRRDG